MPPRVPHGERRRSCMRPPLPNTDSRRSCPGPIPLIRCKVSAASRACFGQRPPAATFLVSRPPLHRARLLRKRFALEVRRGYHPCRAISSLPPSDAKYRLEVQMEYSEGWPADAARGLGPDELGTSGSDGGVAHVHHHAVQFYDDEAFLSSVVCEFLGQGLRRDQPTVIIATPPHRKAFANGLAAVDFDTTRARKEGRLVMLDARHTLSQFMRGSLPDAEKFRAVIGSVIEKALAQRPDGNVCAYGEMVDLLWKDGNVEGAVRLEELWNDLASTYRFSLLCAYSMGN